MIEEWKDIEGYEGLYEISNLGRVRSLDRIVVYSNGRKYFYKGEILKLKVDKYGYNIISFCKNGKHKTYTIHRLVASAFIPNTENKSCIDHINTIKTDNRVENLRWVTNKENMNNPLTLNKYFGKSNHNSRSVFQFNKNMELIKKWDTIKDASKNLNINQSCISMCCSGKRNKSGGYKWGYVEDYELVPFKVFDLKIYKKRSA